MLAMVLHLFSERDDTGPILDIKIATIIIIRHNQMAVDVGRHDIMVAGASLCSPLVQSLLPG